MSQPPWYRTGGTPPPGQPKGTFPQRRGQMIAASENLCSFQSNPGFITGNPTSLSVQAEALDDFAGVTEWVVCVDYAGGTEALQDGTINVDDPSGPFSIYCLIEEGYDASNLPLFQPPTGRTGTGPTSNGQFFPPVHQVPIFGQAFQAHGTLVRATVHVLIDDTGAHPIKVSASIRPGRLQKALVQNQLVASNPATPLATGATLTPRRAVGVRALPQGGPLPGDLVRFETAQGTLIQSAPGPFWPHFSPIPPNATVCRYVTAAAGIITPINFQFEVQS